MALLRAEHLEFNNLMQEHDDRNNRTNSNLEGKHLFNTPVCVYIMYFQTYDFYDFKTILQI